ncbi:MAG: AraC family transcriptional regulator ligand-binding domain-containing protein [Micropepsaceae bacterium]
MHYFSRNVVLQYALELAKNLGVEPARILSGVNISEQTAYRVGGYVQTSKLIDAVEMAALLTARDDFGIVWGKKSDFRTFGVLGVVVAHQHTLSRAFAGIGSYVSRLGTGYTYAIHRDANDAQLQFQTSSRSTIRPRHYTEGMLLMMIRFGRLLSAKAWNPSRICFPHSRMSSQTTYREAFRCPVDFEQVLCAAISPRSRMDMSISIEKSPVQAMLQRVLDGASSQQADNLPAQVALLIPGLLSSGRASASNVASMLNMSPRTLQRRLSNDGSSFRKIVNMVRETIVKDQIKLGLANGEKLAALLGFSEPSAASRFVRNHMGKTASELKSQARRARS